MAYNKNADRNMLYIHVYELTFKRHVMSSCMEPPFGGFFSFKEKTVKPEPEIYEHLIKCYHINPSEAVFLDDVEKNLREAERHGLLTIHVIDRMKAQTELKKMLKKV